MTESAPYARPELLAPAGGVDALRAAVRNGADAVYLGLDVLNARRGAENFTLETLPDATRYAHLRGSKVYLTANVAVLEAEMAAALSMVARAWEAGVDAVIVQDLGLLSALRAALPEVRIHASTQIDAHNAATVETLVALGVSRVTLARELSVAEIADLVAATGAELESFVHGSLCFSHSGQCLFSSMIGGRSANRGLCAQPCRLPYELTGADGRTAEVPGSYLLSPRDLAGITLLPALVRARIAALKIEGRMKSAEYVASVVSVYRAAIDRAWADPDGFAVTPSESERLEEAFNRGFTPGYLADVRDDAMMSYTRPNNRGVPLGRVATATGGRAGIALDRALESGDTIEFWTSEGRFAQTVGPIEVAGRASAAAPAGVRAEIAVERALRPGDRVFRVANAALLDAARRSWQSAEEPRPVPVTFRVRLRIGEPARVDVAGGGAAAFAEGAAVEAARTKPITAPEVVEHVGRLGGTTYRVDDIAIEIDAAAGISYSTLHALRREALEALDAERLRPWAGRRLADTPHPPRLTARRPHRGSPELVVTAAEPDVAAACARAGADRVVLAAPAFARAAEPAGASAVLLPRVAHEAEFGALLDLAGPGTRPIAGNLGMIEQLARRGAPVEADWGLNALNPWAAGALAGLGARLVWASPELSGRQLDALVAGSPVPIGFLVGGRVELMVAEHCVLQAAGACSHECARCTRRLRSWSLSDRKGYRFPVTTDASGRAHVYNSVPLDLSRSLPEILGAGVSAIRLDLHTETPDGAAALVRAWRDRLDRAVAGDPAPAAPVVDPSTSGQFYRGIR